MLPLAISCHNMFVLEQYLNVSNVNLKQNLFFKDFSSGTFNFIMFVIITEKLKRHHYESARIVIGNISDNHQIIIMTTTKENK